MNRRNLFKMFGGASVLSFVPLESKRSEVQRAYGKDAQTQYATVYGRVELASAHKHAKNKEALVRMIEQECDGMKKDFIRAFSNPEHIEKNVLPYTHQALPPYAK